MSSDAITAEGDAGSELRREAGGFLAEAIRRAFPFLFRLSGDREATEDALQEAAYACYRKWSRLRNFDQNEGFAYFTAVARNAFYSAATQGQREIPYSQLPHTFDPIARQGDPYSVVINRDLVARVLNVLSPREKEVLKLLLDGYSPTEAAAILGISPSTARVLAHRARQRATQSA